MKHIPLSAARTPFIRLLLPLLVGIMCAEYLPLPLWASIIPALGGVALWSLYLKRGSVEEEYRKRRYFGIGLFLLIGAWGATLHSFQNRPVSEICSNYPLAIVRIEQRTVEKNSSYYAPAVITALCDSDGTRILHEERVALYFGKSIYAQRLRRGDLILLPYRFSPIKSDTNPYAFDYANYMRHRGIFRSQYLSDPQWKWIGTEKNDWRRRAEAMQERLSLHLQACGLSPHNTRLMRALLLGEQHELPPDLRQYFSASGISHILAVSGLHVSVIATLIYLLLFPLKLSASTRRLRPLLTLLIIWVYCAITGLSPSAVRAGVMTSFLLVAELLDRRNSSLNALFAAAFFMLIYNTHLLFQVSFQLSFFAVAAILLFYPWLNIGGKSRYYIVRWFSSSVALSTAAQLGTLPLAVYYFHTIPWLFLMGNLIVLPLLPIIFGCGLLLLLLSALYLPLSWVGIPLDVLLNGIEQFSYWIYNLPGSHLGGVWLEARYLWFYFGIGTLLYLTFQTRSKQMLWLTLSAGITFLIADLFTSRPSYPEIVVYDDREATVVQLSHREKSYQLLSDTLYTEPTLGEEYRMRNRIKQTERFHLGSSTHQSNDCLIDYPFAQFHGKHIALLNQSHSHKATTASPLSIDYAIIDQSFKGNVSDMLRLFAPRQVVIAANVSPARAIRLQEECMQRGIPCHDIRSQGAWIATITTP